MRSGTGLKSGIEVYRRLTWPLLVPIRRLLPTIGWHIGGGGPRCVDWIVFLLTTLAHHRIALSLFTLRALLLLLPTQHRFTLLLLALLTERSLALCLIALRLLLFAVLTDHGLTPCLQVLLWYLPASRGFILFPFGLLALQASRRNARFFSLSISGFPSLGPPKFQLFSSPLRSCASLVSFALPGIAKATSRRPLAATNNPDRWLATTARRRWSNIFRPRRSGSIWQTPDESDLSYERAAGDSFSAPSA